MSPQHKFLAFEVRSTPRLPNGLKGSEGPRQQFELLEKREGLGADAVVEEEGACNQRGDEVTIKPLHSVRGYRLRRRCLLKCTKGGIALGCDWGRSQHTQRFLHISQPQRCNCSGFSS